MPGSLVLCAFLAVADLVLRLLCVRSYINICTRCGGCGRGRVRPRVPGLRCCELAAVARPGWASGAAWGWASQIGGCF
eukprot:422590-Prymnesium_polylepis.1